MRKLLSLMAACLVASTICAADSSTSPPFEMRLVVDAPSGESEQMSIMSKTRKEVVNVQKVVLLDQTALKSTKVHTDKLGHSQIEIAFTEDGRNRFAEVTRRNISRRLAIIIDGKLFCAPTIRTEIAGGKAQISGDFTDQEAKDLAQKIREAMAKR